MNDKISRRTFIKKVGLGLTHASVLSLLGCQADTEYSDPRIVKVPQLSKKHQIRHSYNQSSHVATFDKCSKWLPMQYFEDKTKWNAIVIHHTATKTGSTSIIDKIHRNRGFDGLGYDFIINNGKGNPDGLVEVGYRWQQQMTGAHCRSRTRSDNYWNRCSIGISLVGNFEEIYPTDRQYESLAELITFLKSRHCISDSSIYAHKQVPGCKTKCPGKHFSWHRLTQKIQYIS